MGRDVVVVGASAGGVEALTQLTRALPIDLPAAVLVVLHIPPHVSSSLPAILSRNGALPARHPTDGQLLRPGEILVAPPDHHLLVDDDRVRLSRGPQENGHRPAVDVLFRTAAFSAGARAIGVVLSGALDDGTAGLISIKERGGLALVQDPEDAVYPGMPLSAIAHVPVDRIANPGELAQYLGQLTRESSGSQPPGRVPWLEFESKIARLDGEAMNSPDRPGTPAGFGCPDCAGALFEIDEGGLTRFRCRVGHAWSADSLLGQHALQLESALWMALRSLEEKAALSAQLHERALGRGNTITAERYAEQTAASLHAAGLIRSMLQSRIGGSDLTPEGPEEDITLG